MGDLHPALQHRLECLEEEVRALIGRVERLEGQRQKAESAPRAPSLPVGSDQAGIITLNDFRGSLAPTKFLAGTALVCFILVIALSLRTIVDNGFVEKPLGAFLGLFYALCVLLYGYYRAARGLQFVSLSITCAILLICSITLEAHFRFDVIPSRLGYAILAGAMLLTLIGGVKYNVRLLLNAAIPTYGLVGIILDFPNPAFVHLAALVALTNVIAFALAKEFRTRSLCWSSLALTLFFWFLWTIKLRIPLMRHEPVQSEAAAEWFLPVLTVFAAGNLGIVLFAALRATRLLGVYETVLPILNAAFVYMAARLVALPSGRSEKALGAVCMLAAAIHLFLAIALAKRSDKGRRAASSLSAAVFVLLTVSVPPITNDPAWSLVLWSISALSFSVTLARQLDPSLQGVACLFQVFVSVMSLHFGSLVAGGPTPVPQVIAAAALSATCLLHYIWLRTRAFVSPQHLSGRALLVWQVAVLVFIVAIVFAFGALRITLYALAAHVMAQPYEVFQCGQSMIINLGALLVAYIGLRIRKGELLGVGALLAAVGAAKVFAFDLFHTQGMPLVLSVLLFGITTTFGSLIWNRWQRTGDAGVANA